MSVSLERVVVRGDTFRQTAQIRDYDGSLFDPDSQAVRLLTPDGSQEGFDMTSPTSDGTGLFHQDIKTPATGDEGEWKVEWEITVGTDTKTERMPFLLVA